MTYEELLKQVQHHVNLYYNQSQPEISDADFDALYDQLLAIEEKQGWKDPTSPTIKVGGAAGKIRHPYKLYSLKKVYNIEEVESTFTVKTPKIDGASLTLVFRNKKLALALTRGDGEFGDDIMHLAPYIKNIPDLQLKENIPDTMVVTGECVTLNKVENFRNYVSGALGLKDPKEFQIKGIYFIAHDWLGYEFNYTTRMEKLALLGFDTVLDEDLCSKFPQDGVVYRLDSYTKSQDLGYTSKYPRFAVALKSREKNTAETVLEDVQWVIGRTGTVNPVGIVSPVVLEDATITRVTLHNLEFILTHNLGLGDIIVLERAGGIIPKLVRVIAHSQTGLKITQAHAEQQLDMQLFRDGPRLMADVVNAEKILEHFVKTLEIKGLGPQSLLKMQLVHPIDLYEENDWSKLGANGEKIKQEIERSKTKPYSTVLAAFGIPGIGKSAAKKIVEILPSFDKLHMIEYEKIPGIGPKTTEKILAWLDVNEDWVLTLPLQLKEEVSIEQILTNKVCKEVALTGKMDITRDELTKILEEKGFIVKSSVTKSCYALISADTDVSSKVQKARSYNIPIINYWDNKEKILSGEF